MRGIFVCLFVFSVMFLSKSWATACSADADCVRVNAACCGCSTGGSSTAVHTSDQATHNSSLKQYCSSHQRPCVYWDKCNYVQAKCQNSQCVAVGESAVPLSDSVFLSSSTTVTSLPNPGRSESNVGSSDLKCSCCASGSFSTECKDTQWSQQCQCWIPASQYSGYHAMTPEQESYLKNEKKWTESALKKTRKQKRS